MLLVSKARHSRRLLVLFLITVFLGTFCISNATCKETTPLDESLFGKLLPIPKKTVPPKAIKEQPKKVEIDSDEEPAPPPKRMGEPKGAKKLSKKEDVWIHADKRVVIIDGRISLNKGFLEMFACPRGTKEHESIIALDSKAALVHVALLNIGADSGHPVQYDPKYQPATGTKISIEVLWVDEKSKRHHINAKKWIRDLKTKKELSIDWVFAGSGFWRDEETGKKFYKANGGEMICVSNFSSAMLDLPIESSVSNDDLVFEAFEGRIPPLGTHVRLVLKPIHDDSKKKPDKKKSEPKKPLSKKTPSEKAKPKKIEPEDKKPTE